MPDIRTQKLLYHLTSMKNLRSILESGLLPRALLRNFEGVVDQAIKAPSEGIAEAVAYEIARLELSLEADVNRAMFLR